LTNPIQSISLVFVGPKQAQALNRQYRQQNYTPVVLSFFYGDEACLGEVIICLAAAKRQGLTLKALINHGVQDLLSQIPTSSLCGVGFSRNPAEFN
jgi:ssRNA-specific RNase YbeY (16S rRNA maturation enzyme)